MILISTFSGEERHLYLTVIKALKVEGIRHTSLTRLILHVGMSWYSIS